MEKAFYLWFERFDASEKFCGDFDGCFFFINELLMQLTNRSHVQLPVTTTVRSKQQPQTAKTILASVWLSVS
jgi:hypothetical protein